MPDYVPSERCLNAIYTALHTAGLLSLPGDALLVELDNIAAERWPAVPIKGCEELMKHPRSRALAMSLALLWPSGRWDPLEARHEFRNLSTDLTDAWEIVQHKPAEKLRKTVDHVVVGGVRRNWPPARDVFTYALIGDMR